MDVPIQFWALLLSVLFGVLCYMIADRKGLSAPLWAIIGFVVPVLGLIGVLIVPRNKAEKKQGAGR